MQESEEVIDEVDLVYRTCSRFDSSFYERIATALANDLEREREASDDEENMDASALEDGEDADSCYFPNDEEASDAEQDQEFEVQEEFQSDDENEEEVEEENDELIQAESHQFFLQKMVQNGVKYHHKREDSGPIMLYVPKVAQSKILQFQLKYLKKCLRQTLFL